MKYSDYNLVTLNFTQDGNTTFVTDWFTKTEMNSILSRLRKSNIIMAKVTRQNGYSFINVGCIQGYDSIGYPIYNFTSNGVKLNLIVDNNDDGSLRRFRIYNDQE